MRAEPHQKIQLRKAYWNIQFDKLLWDNAVALNLLYIETIAELKNGHIKPSEEAADQLAEFRSSRDRKAFLELAREQPGYAFAQFGEATVNYPEVGPRLAGWGIQRLRPFKSDAARMRGLQPFTMGVTGGRKIVINTARTMQEEGK